MINILKERFNNNMKRHININWDDVEKKIKSKEERPIARSLSFATFVTLLLSFVSQQKVI